MAEEGYTKAFQARMVRVLYQDPDFAIALGPHLDKQFFDNKVHRFFAQKIIQYALQHLHGIKKSSLQIEVQKAFRAGRLDKEKDEVAVDAFMSRLSAKVKDRTYVKEQTYQFIKHQKIRLMMLDGLEHMKTGDYDAIDRSMNEVLNVQPVSESPHWMMRERKARRKRRESYVPNGVPTGIAFDKHLKPGGLPPKQLGAVIAPPSGGKCLDPNTWILRASGERARARDIRGGDKLLGPGGAVRTVLATTTGRDQMYQVIPTSTSGGDGFICNSVHVLTVRDYYTKQVVDVPLNEFLTWSHDRRRRAQLVYGGAVSFTQHPQIGAFATLPMDPWFLGFWYAEGTKDLKGVAVTTAETCVVPRLQEYAAAWGLQCRNQAAADRCPTWRFSSATCLGRSNPLLDTLRAVVGDQKRIPEVVRYGSLDVRRAFLAGWFDGDGHRHKTTALEVTTRSRLWAEDLAFIARSIGLRVALSPKDVYLKGWNRSRTYWRLYVTGDFSEVPFVVTRKKPATHTRGVCFLVKPLGPGPYAGFELDGDGRFLLADFVVTHNTNTLISFGKNALLQGFPVLHFTLELSKEVIQDRYDAALTGIPINELEEGKNPKKIQNWWYRLSKTVDSPELLIIREWPAYRTTPRDIDREILLLERQGFYPGLVIVDYADLLMPTTRYRRSDSKWDDQGNVYVELRQVSVDRAIPFWTAVQGNKQSLGKEVIHMGDISGAHEKAAHSDVMVALCQTDEEKMRKHARFFIVKNRNGAAEFSLPVRVNWACPTIINR